MWGPPACMTITDSRGIENSQCGLDWGKNEPHPLYLIGKMGHLHPYFCKINGLDERSTMVDGWTGKLLMHAVHTP